MPFSYDELEQFYEGLVTRARSRGIACAITSGMACVAYGVSEATKDCDLLCIPNSASELLELLSETTLGGQLAELPWQSYSAVGCALVSRRMDEPLCVAPCGSGAYLDVFGVAPRGSSPWESEIQGLLRQSAYRGGNEAHQSR